jgi:hypothetical protein
MIIQPLQPGAKSKRYARKPKPPVINASASAKLIALRTALIAALPAELGEAIGRPHHP